MLIRKRPLELTEAGVIFSEGAEKILSIKSQILKDITSKMEQDPRRLKLAISTFEAPPLRKSGDLALFQELPFVLLKGMSGHISLFLEELFQSFGFTPQTKLQSDNGNLNAELCLHGTGAMAGSFFYERARFQDALVASDDPLYLIPLRTKRGTIPIAVSYLQGKQFNTVEKRFIEEARNFMTEHSALFVGTDYAVKSISTDLFY